MSFEFGNLRLSVFGESHGAAVGMVLEGLPAGFRLNEEKLAAFLARRAPGSAPWATPRKEKDEPRFLSGVLNGTLTGAPLCVLFENTGGRSADYEALSKKPRPGHADFTAFLKYGGNADLRGGGRFSGRLTAPLCAAGGVCLQLLEERDIWIGAHLLSVEKVQGTPYDPVSLEKETLLFAGRAPFPAQNEEEGEKMRQAIAAAAAEGDSVGGGVECAALGLPGGLGGPLEEGLEGKLSLALFAIPAVKGVEFGDGFAAAARRGSANNDAFCVEKGAVKTQTNHCGGLLGGITNTMPLLLRAAMKPTPSIAKEQRTVDLETLTAAPIQVAGRHDPCVAPRAVPCVEAAVALVLAGEILKQEGEANHGAN